MGSGQRAVEGHGTDDSADLVEGHGCEDYFSMKEEPLESIS